MFTVLLIVLLSTILFHVLKAPIVRDTYSYKQHWSMDDEAYLPRRRINKWLHRSEHKKYRSLNGGIFRCFLDASKAFDMVNHSVLFRKLMQRGIPWYIINILCYWYHSQTMCVRWGDSVSSFFGVSNGVRQGGILSPYLFNVYMDDYGAI